LILLPVLVLAEGESFYKEPGLFSTRPSATKITRFGPVGLGIDLILPPFTMRIQKVQYGSPTAAPGKLAVGQIIESINGETLKDIDPRIQLGDIITKAEATEDVILLKIKDYLMVKSGGFSIHQKPGWKSSWLVLQRPQ
jgi:hypothetical protein